MGEVWEALHPDRRVPLAVKFLKRGAPAQRRSIAAFWNEIRAMAVLDHPHVLRLLDFGELSAPLETPAGGEPLPAGCPYLVLELARGGDLSAWLGQTRSWEEISAVLSGLLDALAHAHARGVLHLDLKPANVLWCGAGDERPGLKLGDFGIAHLWTGASPAGGSSGTPAYMAPEQHRSLAGALGPWTDLYAVGLVAWAQVHGALPAALNTTLSTRGQWDPLRPPRMAVPEDIYPWLERLLREDPAERYRRAADAAWALRRTGEAPLVASGEAPAHPESGGLTVAITGGTTWSTRPSRGDAPLAPWPPLSSPTRRADVPPVPMDGMAPVEPRPLPLRGLGAALHGLAVPPMVGRRSEQEALWAALVETAAAGRAQVVLVRGPAGFGKSRLLQWLAERAHELGAAEVLRAVHSAEGGIQDGLWSMATRALVLPEVGEAGAPAVAAMRPAERFPYLSALLVGHSQGRVGLVAVDDAQWGQEALEFVDFVLGRQELDPAPQLFVLAVQEEALATRPAEGALLGALGMRAGVRSLDVGPLRTADWPRMVDAFLTLEPGLAALVAEGTQGNPSFLAQLLDDWLGRGLLESTPAGYAALGAACLRVPGDLDHFWAQRARSTLGELGPGAREALELAAVLGAEVDGAEWAAVCACAGCEAGPELVAALLARGIARPGAGGIGLGWAFAHGLLRQALLREAEQGQRLPALHTWCAEGLGALPAEGRWVRVGRHFVAAGLPDRALEPLLVGLGRSLNHLPIAAARGVLDLLERALDGAGVPEVDLRRWTFRLYRNTVGRRDIFHRAQLDPELQILEAQAREMGWSSELAAVLRDRAVLLHDLGRFHEAEAVGAEALALLRAAGSSPTVGLANVLGSLAMIWLQLQRVEQAEAAYRSASEIYEAKGELFLAGAARAGLAQGALHQERLDEAERQVALAHAFAERSGSAHARAEAQALWGEVRRKRGDLVAAEALFRRAVQGFQALGSTREALPTVNLALVFLAQGRMSEARAMSERVLVLARAPGAGWLEVHGHVHLLVPCALARDWPAWEEHLSRAEVLCALDPPADVDLARLAREGVVLLEAAGEGERATRAGKLAERLGEVVGYSPQDSQTRRA